MKLAKHLNKFMITEYIKPICLPAGDKLKNLNYDDVDLEVAGWGKTENGNTEITKFRTS